MPLPDPTSPIVQAPARCGVGLRFNFVRFPAPSWPEDWWQRNYDLLYEPNAPDPLPLTSRMKRIPGFVYPGDET
jgi:hypothetical protein